MDAKGQAFFILFPFYRIVLHHFQGVTVSFTPSDFVRLTDRERDSERVPDFIYLGLSHIYDCGVIHSVEPAWSEVNVVPFCFPETELRKNMYRNRLQVIEADPGARCISQLYMDDSLDQGFDVPTVEREQAVFCCLPSSCTHVKFICRCHFDFSYHNRIERFARL